MTRGREFGFWVALALAVRVLAGVAFSGPLERAHEAGIAKDGEIGYLPFATHLLELGEFSLEPGEPSASHVPGYPLLLAGAIALAGTHERAVFALQTALGALVVGLVFQIAAALAGTLVGRLSAFGALMLPDLVAYSLLNLTETPHLACVLAATLAMLAALRTGSPRAAVLLGLALAAGVLIREGTLALAALWMAALVLPVAAARRGQAAIVGAILVAVLAPWWLRNWSVFGEFIPLTTKGMSNFYQSTMIRPYPLTDYRNKDVVLDPETAAREAEVQRRKDAATSPSEFDRVLLEAALDNIRRDPMAQVAHLGRKIVWLWTPNIAPRHADRIGVGAVLWGAATLHFLVLGLGLVGLFRLRHKLEVAILLSLPLLLTTGVHVVLSGAEPRYHFSAWPALLVGTSVVVEPLVVRAREWVFAGRSGRP